MTIQIGTWVRLPDGRADFVWEASAEGLFMSREFKRGYHAAELRELTQEEIERALDDSDARFPAVVRPPLTEAEAAEKIRRIDLRKQIRLARDLLRSGRALTVEDAFKLADAFTAEERRRLSNAVRGAQEGGSDERNDS